MLNYAPYEKKRCKICSHSLQKWGKNKSGSVRYRCPQCSTSQTRKRTDIAVINQKKLFSSWLLGKQSLSVIAESSNVSLKTLLRRFDDFWSNTPEPKDVTTQDAVILLDGKYLRRDSCVLVAATTKKVVTWRFDERERYESWKALVDQMIHVPLAVVCDGQKGMTKAIKERFPGITIQRCQFHVIKYCITRLTRNPKTEAGQELRGIVKHISKIKKREDLKTWFEEYLHRRSTYDTFLKEKRYHNTLTLTGRQRWSYTHKSVRSSDSHLKNALPNLFHYIHNKQIPNTTNFVEGAINRKIQEQLGNHRGLILSKQHILISYLLRSLQ